MVKIILANLTQQLWYPMVLFLSLISEFLSTQNLMIVYYGLVQYLLTCGLVCPWGGIQEYANFAVQTENVQRTKH